jgi:TolB protein
MTQRTAQRWKIIAGAVLGLACAGMPGSILESGAADVYLEASRPDFQKVPIGILGFQDGSLPSRPGKVAADVLAADLRRSQVFAVADASKLGVGLTGPNGPEKQKLKQAVESGLKVLVWGTISTREPDYLLDRFVYDDVSDGIGAGKRYVGSTSLLRQITHRLADELVARYTGEPGIARTRIAYVSERKGARELFVMDYDGHAARQLTSDGFLNLAPQWSPDRQFLVFTSYQSRTRQNIELVNLSTGKRSPLVSLAGLNITPALSPDGTKLAFATSQDGNSEIYTMEMQTKALQRLTDHPAGDLSPSWAPTGREIAFTSDRGGGPQIYLMSADGSNVRRLTFDGDYNAAPAWSPRGNWIAYVCRSEQQNYKICLISPDGQKRAQVTSGAGIDDSPSWSPDGRHIAFSSTSGGKTQVYMINSDGKEMEPLTSSGLHNSMPAWSSAETQKVDSQPTRKK